MDRHSNHFPHYPISTNTKLFKACKSLILSSVPYHSLTSPPPILPPPLFLKPTSNTTPSPPPFPYHQPPSPTTTITPLPYHHQPPFPNPPSLYMSNLFNRPGAWPWSLLSCRNYFEILVIQGLWCNDPY